MSITFMKGCVFMPRFNGTGPNGEGPLTGRGLGQCNTLSGCPGPSVKYLCTIHMVE